MNNNDDLSELNPWRSIKELRENRDFWQRTAEREADAAGYYQEQLAAAHELLGRVVHQSSERWDTLNLTRHFPIDNLRHKRSVNNPSGKSTK